MNEAPLSKVTQCLCGRRWFRTPDGPPRFLSGIAFAFTDAAPDPGHCYCGLALERVAWPAATLSPAQQAALKAFLNELGLDFRPQRGTEPVAAVRVDQDLDAAAAQSLHRIHAAVRCRAPSTETLASYEKDLAGLEERIRVLTHTMRVMGLAFDLTDPMDIANRAMAIALNKRSQPSDLTALTQIARVLGIGLVGSPGPSVVATLVGQVEKLIEAVRSLDRIAAILKRGLPSMETLATYARDLKALEENVEMTSERAITLKSAMDAIARVLGVPASATTAEIVDRVCSIARPHML